MPIKRQEMHPFTLLSVLNCTFQAIYMFYALAIVCDDYFVPSLEKISEVRKLRQPAFRRNFPLSLTWWCDSSYSS